MKVLIVDDVEMNLKLLRTILEADGQEVIQAGDGAEALALLESQGADAIISDILMPVMDGYRLCDEVRHRERFKRLPFIIYSATYTSAADEKLSLDFGADVYLKKPAPRQILLNALHQVADDPANHTPPVATRNHQVVMKEYNQALLVKLEEKCVELEKAKVRLTQINAELEKRLHLEDQYRQAQKMEAVGLLAGGVAHDFNNLLTVINGYTNILTDNDVEPTRAREMFVQIRQAGERAAALTQQLLAYSRKQVLNPAVIDLNKLVSNVQKMLGRLIEENINLLPILAPTPCWVKADFHQIEQVITNLVINSRDATPQGGSISIETSHITLDEVSADEYGVMPPGRYVLLSVRDTGCGMSKEVAARVFEPFFTTKDLGQGTGLGLATVYGIVKQSEGHIRLTSEVGHGTTFRIYLPALEETVQPLAPQPVDDEMPTGTETVLLVENEESVRELSRTIMEMAGYKVLEASDGQAAMELVARHKEPIDLLVTDVIMPKMGGVELVEVLHTQRPTMRVLYLSGYTADAVLRHLDPDSKASFLQKPFTVNELTRKIREILDVKGDPF